MAFQRPFLVSLRRPDSQVPWGFRLIGGSNAQPQHLVQQVFEGSQAEKAGLHVGDEVIQLGRVNVQSLSHREVEEVILRCKDRIEMFIIREDLFRGRNENEPPTVKAVVHSTYNSPFQLYSTENVADTLALQTTVLTESQPKLNHLGPQSPPVVLQSDVLKFVKEQEGKRYLNGDIYPTPPPRKKQPPPPPPKPTVRFQDPLVVTSPTAKTEQQTEYETRSQSFQTHKTVRQVYQTQHTGQQNQAYQPQLESTRGQQDSSNFKSQVTFQPQSPKPQEGQRIPLQSQENRVQSQREDYQHKRYEEQQRIQQQQQEQYRQQELERARQQQIAQRQEQIRQQQIAKQQEDIRQRQIVQQQEQQRQYQIAQQQEQQRQQQLAQQQEQQRQHQLAQQQEQQRQQQLAQQRAQQQYKQQQASPQPQQREQIFPYEQANRAQGPRHPGATPNVRTKESFDRFVGANNMKYTSTSRITPKPESPIMLGHGVSPVWPPKNSSVRDVPKTGFSPGYIQDKCSKKFTWPPPKNDDYDPYNRSITPTGTVVNAWHPADSPTPRSLPFAKSPTPTGRTKDIMWPPPHTQPKESPRHSPRVVRRGTGRFDDYVQQHASISLPPTYRTPPGTQHVEIVYEDDSEED